MTNKEWVEGLSRLRRSNLDREVLRKLEAVLFTKDGETLTTESSGSWSRTVAVAALANINLEATPVTGPHVLFPELTVEQLQYSMAVISADYWALHC